MARVVVAAEGLPVIAQDRFDRDAAHRQDVEPEQHGPDAVFLAHVVGAGARTLLAAERDAAGVEQVAGGGAIILFRVRISAPFHMPNVRAKRATTAGRQARAGENVPRTARPGLVACRWRSA